MSNPAPGWYPAPHANGEQRYWDGSQWQEPTAPTPPATGDVAPGSPAPAQAPKALALSALIVGIVAFLTGLLPVVGAIIGAVAIILGIVALVKKQSKGLSITGIVLGSIAMIASIAMTIGFTAFTANLPQSTSTQTPTATEAPVSEDSEPSTEPSTEPPAAPTTPDLATFAETDDRNWALIAKDPDSHAGTNLILYGTITQFDSATGRCAMLISTAATQKEMSYDYEQNVMAYSGDGTTTCPTFDPLVEGDHIKVWATVIESFSYDTQIGGNTTVPLIEVWQAELLPATEY